MEICPSIIKSQNDMLEIDIIIPQANWVSAKSGRRRTSGNEDKGDTVPIFKERHIGKPVSEIVTYAEAEVCLPTVVHLCIASFAMVVLGDTLE